MLGVIVELAISWLLLWFFEKKHLSALGIMPTKSRLTHLGIGFLMAAACCALYYFSFTIFGANRWTLNNRFTAEAFAINAWWNLKSVLFEEFLFRGALLYIAIRLMGIRAACFLSAMAFGAYHWFSYGIWGNPVPMILVFILTGFWGFMFAMAFARTGSMYLPIGLHFGWNLVNTVVFSQGPLGNQLLINANTSAQKLGVAISLLIFLIQLLALPLLTWWYLHQTQKIFCSIHQIKG